MSAGQPASSDSVWASWRLIGSSFIIHTESQHHWRGVTSQCDLCNLLELVFLLIRTLNRSFLFCLFASGSEPGSPQTKPGIYLRKPGILVYTRHQPIAPPAYRLRPPDSCWAPASRTFRAGAGLRFWPFCRKAQTSKGIYIVTCKANKLCRCSRSADPWNTDLASPCEAIRLAPYKICGLQPYSVRIPARPPSIPQHSAAGPCSSSLRPFKRRQLPCLSFRRAKQRAPLFNRWRSALPTCRG